MPRGRGNRGGMKWGGYGGWFLKLLLLLLIRKTPSHGYDLAAKLSPFGYSIQGRGGMGPIYRLLRDLEMEGLIMSSWETPGSIGGPARRIYTITPLGEATLSTWIEDLRQQKALIDQIIRLYEEN